MTLRLKDIGIFFILILFRIGLVVESSISDEIHLDLKRLKQVAEIHPLFLSFTIDSASLARHWKNINLRDSRLIYLTKFLGPAFLRVGGTMQDNLRFCPKEARTNSSCTTMGADQESPLFESDILELGRFVNETGTILIYGLNALQRNESDWDPRNSLALMRFMKSIGMHPAAYELGNEPQLFQKTFNRTVTAADLGKDFNLLRTLVSKRQQILGPDLNDIRNPEKRNGFMTDFLQAVSNETLSAFTFHDYTFSGVKATVLDFINPGLMDRLSMHIKMVKKSLHKYQKPFPIWLGETSSAWGGGALNISDRFISNFMWLDKLGQSALHDVKVVIREALVGPNIPYVLIDKWFRPSPNYFISYIFKRLVGTTVLNIQDKFEKNRRVRIYAHCAMDKKAGAIVLYALNLCSDKPAKLILNTSHDISEYLVTAHQNDLLSRFADMNGKILKFARPEVPIALNPKRISDTDTILIPPLSLGFWVIGSANVSSCK